MFISIDTETTGLDPETCQVLQLSAVAWTDDDVNKCPTFSMYVDPAKGDPHGAYGHGIRGEAYALHLNAWILKELIDGNGYTVAFVTKQFAGWLACLADEICVPSKYFTPMGMNYSSFDLQFLKRMYDFPLHAFKHRALEVGSLYANKEGIPSSAVIFPGVAERHNIQGEAHEALYDAKCALAAAMEKLV